MNKVIIIFIIILYFYFKFDILFTNSRKKIKIAIDTEEMIPIFKKILLLSDLDIEFVITTSKKDNLRLLKNNEVNLALLREDQDLEDFDYICALYKEYLTYFTDKNLDTSMSNPNDDYFESPIDGKKIKWKGDTIHNFLGIDKNDKSPESSNGIILFSHHPNKKIENLINKYPIKFNHFLLDDSFTNKHRYYKRDNLYIIKSYPNIWSRDKYRQPNIKTYSSRVLLMSNKNVHNKTVYEIVKNIFLYKQFFEELPFIDNINLIESSAPIELKNNIHKGALKYFTEFFNNRIK